VVIGGGENGVNVYQGSGWSSVSYPPIPSGAGNSSYDTAVAVSSDGSEILVGSSDWGDPSNTLTTSEGDAYVLSGSGWEQSQQLLAPDAAKNDAFGTAVALSPDTSTALIGAPQHNGTGAGYVFSSSATPPSTTTTTTEPLTPIVPSQEAELAEAHGSTGDLAGESVAMSTNGSVIAVGVPGTAGGGAVDVFYGTSWSKETTLTEPGGGAGDDFGASVSVSGDGSSIAVGAPAGVAPYWFGLGEAFVFSGSDWHSEHEVPFPASTTQAEAEGFGPRWRSRTTTRPSSSARPPPSTAQPTKVPSTSSTPRTPAAGHWRRR
jgi:hypothetical protein